MTYPYHYHEHKHCKYLYEGLLDYLTDTYDVNDIPAPLSKYAVYLRNKVDSNPVSILDYTDSLEYPLNDEEDRRYPSEQFLISLRYTIMQMTADKFRKIMRLVCEAWWDFCEDDYVVADEDKMKYRLYTCGWSGNEDILDALLGNPAIRTAVDVVNRGAVYEISYELSI